MYGTMWILTLGVIDDSMMYGTMWLLILGVIDDKDDVWDHVDTDTWSGRYMVLYDYDFDYL